MATRAIFCIALLLGAVTLYFWKPQNFIDSGLWGQQAEWFMTGNPQMFDLGKAYGHPGGPLIETGIALHDALGWRYETGIAYFEIVLGAFAIATAVALTYTLRRDWLWTFGALGLLLFEPFYLEATPPTFLATMLGVVLALISLYLYEQPARPSLSLMLAWSVVAGAMAASRADMGGVETVTFGLLLWTRFGARFSLSAVGSAFVAFCVFDPFMWYMPISQIQGIIEKMLVHYTGTLVKGRSYLSSIASYSARALASSGLGLVALIGGSRFEIGVPRRYLAFLIGMTGLVCLILLTSSFDASRYFMPLVFVWDTFLPLFVIVLFERLPLPGLAVGERSRRILAAGAIALIIATPAAIAVHAMGFA